jgi:transcriptional regulator with XRE-family HTH domain
MSFGEFVKARRQMCGLTLEALAEKISSHKGYISGWENGKVNPPSPKVLKRLASALKTDETILMLMGYAEKAPKEIREAVKLKLL